MEKKIIIFLLVLINMVVISETRAEIVGNPAQAALMTQGLIMGEGILGLTGSGIYDFQTKKYKTGETTGDTELMYYGIQVGCIVANNLMFYGMLGNGRIIKKIQLEYDQTYYAPDDEDEELELSWKADINRNYETDQDLVWGLGFSMILYTKKITENNTLWLTFDFKYTHISLDVDERKKNGTTYAWSSDERQGSLALAYQIGPAVPYAGFKVLRVSGREMHTIINTHKYGKLTEPTVGHRVDISPGENFGIFAGISFHYNENLAIGFEARSADERGYSCWASVMF